MTNPAWERIPAFLHDLIATVRAPACALSDADGQVRALGVHGVFVSDQRVLSEAHLRFGGAEVQGLAHMSAGPGCTRFVGVVRGFGDPIADPTVRLERLRRMAPDGMTENIRISSTATMTVAARVTLALQCDLLPLEQVRIGRAGPGLTSQLHSASQVHSGRMVLARRRCRRDRERAWRAGRIRPAGLGRQSCARRVGGSDLVGARRGALAHSGRTTGTGAMAAA